VQVFANMCTIFTIRRNASLLLKGTFNIPNSPCSSTALRHPPNRKTPYLLSRVLPSPADIDALAQIPEEIEVIRELLDSSDESTQAHPPPPPKLP
jgi:hypothetical protein